jgi:hypothetical protein
MILISRSEKPERPAPEPELATSILFILPSLVEFLACSYRRMNAEKDGALCARGSRRSCVPCAALRLPSNPSSRPGSCRSGAPALLQPATATGASPVPLRRALHMSQGKWQIQATKNIITFYVMIRIITYGEYYSLSECRGLRHSVPSQCPPSESSLHDTDHAMSCRYVCGTGTSARHPVRERDNAGGSSESYCKQSLALQK